MITKSVFGKRVEGSQVQIITQYRLFGILLYQVAVDEHIATRFGSVV